MPSRDRLVVEQERLGIYQAELDEPTFQTLLTLSQRRFAADEIAIVGLHGEAKASFQHVVLVGDVMPKMLERLFEGRLGNYAAILLIEEAYCQ